MPHCGLLCVLRVAGIRNEWNFENKIIIIYYYVQN